MHTIFTGSRDSNAPFLKEMRLYPFEVVPSGNMIIEGNYLPSLINLARSWRATLT